MVGKVALDRRRRNAPKRILMMDPTHHWTAMTLSFVMHYLHKGPINFFSSIPHCLKNNYYFIFLFLIFFRNIIYYCFFIIPHKLLYFKSTEKLISTCFFFWKRCSTAYSLSISGSRFTSAEPPSFSFFSFDICSYLIISISFNILKAPRILFGPRIFSEPSRNHSSISVVWSSYGSKKFTRRHAVAFI